MAQRRARTLLRPMTGSRCARHMHNHRGRPYSLHGVRWPLLQLQHIPPPLAHTEWTHLKALSAPSVNDSMVRRHASIRLPHAGLLRERSKEHSSVGAACFRDAREGAAEWAHRLGPRPGSRRALALQVRHICSCPFRLNICQSISYCCFPMQTCAYPITAVLPHADIC